MVSFYRSQLLANKEIDNQFYSCMKNKQELNIPLLIINITNRFEVGEKQVNKRINLLVSAYEGQASIKSDYVEFK
jgi:hypothetical protein